MKAVLVLNSASDRFAGQAALIDDILAPCRAAFTRVELWIFYTGIPPERFPETSIRINAIRLIKTDPQNPPESVLSLLEQTCRKSDPGLMVFGSDSHSQELATRVSYRLNGSSCLQVERLKMEAQTLTVTKPSYTGSLKAVLALKQTPWCLSVANRPCRPLKLSPPPCPVEPVTGLKPIACDWIQSSRYTADAKQNNLEQSETVLAVGRGIRSKENMAVVKRTARALGAAIGASRPVVMNAWIDMEHLIGISGRVVAPERCLAAGVSGTGAFTAGIEKSRLIIAVNTDDQAPIFDIADIGIIDDAMPFLMALEEEADRASEQGDHRPDE